MPRWIKLATLSAAVVFLVLAFVCAWFRAEFHGESLRVFLSWLSPLHDSGLVAELCNPAECITAPSGRIAGGMAWIGSFAVHASIVMLAISAYQVARDRPIDQLALWSVGTSAGVLVLTVLIWLSFDGPEGWDNRTGAGLWCALGGALLGGVGQTRVFDLLEPEHELPIAAPPAPPPPAVLRPAPVSATERVSAGEFAFAGLRLGTAAGIVRVAWDDVVRATLVAGPALELITRAGSTLRIDAASRIDYRFLPGGQARDDAENLRRLHAFACARNPALR